MTTPAIAFLLMPSQSSVRHGVGTGSKVKERTDAENEIDHQDEDSRPIVPLKGETGGQAGGQAAEQSGDSKAEDADKQHPAAATLPARLLVHLPALRLGLYRPPRTLTTSLSLICH